MRSQAVKYHLKEVDDFNSLKPLVQAFFDASRPNMRAWKTSYPEIVTQFPDRESLDDRAILHLLVACELGHVLTHCGITFKSPDGITSFTPEDCLMILETDVDAVNSKGQTPFMRAVAAQHWPISWLLHQLGANLHVMDNAGCTLAHLAAMLLQNLGIIHQFPCLRREDRLT